MTETQMDLTQHETCSGFLERACCGVTSLELHVLYLVTCLLIGLLNFVTVQPLAFIQYAETANTSRSKRTIRKEMMKSKFNRQVEEKWARLSGQRNDSRKEMLEK